MGLENLPLSSVGAVRESKRNTPVQTASSRPPLIKKISVAQQSKDPLIIANLLYDKHFPPLPSNISQYKKRMKCHL